MCAGDGMGLFVMEMSLEDERLCSDAFKIQAHSEDGPGQISRPFAYR